MFTSSRVWRQVYHRQPSGHNGKPHRWSSERLHTSFARTAWSSNHYDVRWNQHRRIVRVSCAHSICATLSCLMLQTTLLHNVYHIVTSDMFVQLECICRLAKVLFSFKEMHERILHQIHWVTALPNESKIGRENHRCTQRIYSSPRQLRSFLCRTRLWALRLLFRAIFILDIGTGKEVCGFALCVRQKSQPYPQQHAIMLNTLFVVIRGSFFGLLPPAFGSSTSASRSSSDSVWAESSISESTNLRMELAMTRGKG